MRHIYDRYLSGASINEIAREMEEKGVCGVRGKPLSRTTIRRILTSELYAGDMLLQKYFSPEVRKPRPNGGEEPMYLVRDAHPAIVSREELAAARERMSGRAGDCDNAGWRPHRFAGMVRCGKCGYACCHVGGRRETSPARIECTRRKGGGCDLLPMPESELEAAFERELSPSDRPERIVLFDDRAEFIMESGKVKTVRRSYPEGKHGCFTGKVFCSGCGRTFVRAAKKDRVLWVCNTRNLDRNACEVRSITESELAEAAEAVTGAEDYRIGFHSTVGRVTVYNDRLEFSMKDGEVRTWQRR